MSIVYEVTLHVEPSLLPGYDIWLREHVEEMLSLPGFEAAQIFAIEPDTGTGETIGRVVHYRLASRHALDDYLHRHAERMRNDGLARFGNRVTASRRILLPENR